MLAAHDPVDWPKLLTFLDERLPGTRDQIRGASPAELEALRRRSPVQLPENYVGFLRHFGGADGGFRVFPRHYYLASELLTGPDARWDPARYLLFGIMEDKNCEAPFDLLLDLARGDAMDAPLVGMPPAHDDDDDNDDDDDDDEPLPTQIAPSLADRLIFHIAWRCASQNKTAKARLVAFGQPPHGDTALLTRYRELVAVAEKLGFTPCVSATRNTWVGRRDGETFVNIHTALSNNLVAIELRGDDPVSVAQVREVVEDLGLAQPVRILGD